MPRKPKQPREDGKIIRYTTIKARIYPTEKQAELFKKTFDCCRYIWNHMLTDQQEFYWATDKHFIPTPAKYKKEAPFLTEVDNQALIQEHNHLSQAFRSFFKNPTHFGAPRFKKKKNCRDSFSACNHEFPSGDTIYLTRDGIRMTKAGIVKATFPRRPRGGWKLKRITVEKTKTGKYYCSILYEMAIKKPEPVIPTPETTLGLKYSLSRFCAADNGEFTDSPHWLKESQEKLAKLQRQLCRMQPGSKNYQEAVQKYRLLHEHISNQRRDFIHKETRRIANAWDAVCMRGDSMMEMSKMTILPGNVLDAGMGMFRNFLRYKLEQQGKPLLLVERYAATTRTCSCCGHVLSASPHRKEKWICPECGAILHRETNAAKNIKALGLADYYRSEKRATA